MTNAVLRVDEVETLEGVTWVTFHVSGSGFPDPQTIRVRAGVGDTLTISWPMDRAIDEFIRELKKIREEMTNV